MKTERGQQRPDINNEIVVSLYDNGRLTMKEVGAILGISSDSVLNRLHGVGIRLHTRHKINHDVFNIPSKEGCYWGGFIAADGCINNKKTVVTVELQRSDKKHLEKLCLFVGRDNKTWNRERIRGNKRLKYSTISVVSKKIVSDLEVNFNIVPRKSMVLDKPNIPANCVNHFIRGYIDGDGHIGWHNGAPRINVVSGSKKILYWIRDEIVSGVSGTFCPAILARHNGSTLSIEFGGKNSYNIIEWLYSDSTESTRLERKFERITEYLNKR